jgi:hypothetical protein
MATAYNSTLARINVLSRFVDHPTSGLKDAAMSLPAGKIFTLEIQDEKEIGGFRGAANADKQIVAIPTCKEIGKQAGTTTSSEQLFIRGGKVRPGKHKFGKLNTQANEIEISSSHQK